MNAQVAKANQALAATQTQIKTIDSELPALTSQSRDLHDAVIAARVNLKAKPAEIEAVAAAELKLADQLTKLAQKRRARLGANKAIVTYKQTAAAKKLEADKLAATMPPLKAKLDAVSKAAAQAKEERAHRRALLVEAQELAKRMVEQARTETPEAGSDDSAFMMSWAAVDPTLDARVDTFLQTEMEPETTRGWMLNDA